MQLCNDQNLFNQATQAIFSMILRQIDLTDKQIKAIRIDKARRWREGIRNEGITVAASARIVGEPVVNLYRWEADPKVHSLRPKRLFEKD